MRLVEELTETTKLTAYRIGSRLLGLLDILYRLQTGWNAYKFCKLGIFFDKQLSFHLMETGSYENNSF